MSQLLIFHPLSDFISFLCKNSFETTISSLCQVVRNCTKAGIFKIYICFLFLITQYTGFVSTVRSYLPLVKAKQITHCFNQQTPYLLSYSNDNRIHVFITIWTGQSIDQLIIQCGMIILGVNHQTHQVLYVFAIYCHLYLYPSIL